MPTAAWAHAQSDKGQLDEAIACYRKAIELDPKLAVAHNNLGFALLGKGQTDLAIASYRKAIEIDPKLAMAHGNLGIALMRKGQTELGNRQLPQGHRNRPEARRELSATWALLCAR